MTRIQAAIQPRAGKAIRLYAEGTYVALRAVLRAQPAQYYRLPLQDDAQPAFEDDHYRADVLQAAARSFAREGADLICTAPARGSPPVSRARPLNDHLGKVYPDVPTAQRELSIVAVP